MTARMCSCIWVSGSMLVMEEYKFESDGQQACGLGSVYGEPPWENQECIGVKVRTCGCNILCVKGEYSQG